MSDYYQFNIPDNLRREWEFGKQDQRPVRICANINTQSFGDFINRLFYVNTVAEQFDNSTISIIYRNDVDFKTDMIRLIPRPVTTMVVPADQLLPSLDILNPTLQVKIPIGTEDWFKAGLDRQDIFITEGMTNSHRLQAFERLGHLRFPDDCADAYTEELVKRGVDPNRWFCTLHAREPGYHTKADVRNFRDCDPEVFFEAATHIIMNLGGQVVRLGHPQMTRYPSVPDLIDLSVEESNSFLQVFAINRSRFLLCGASGPWCAAEAFHLPLAAANTVNYFCSNDRAVIRTVDVHTPDGKILNQRELVETGMDKNILAGLQNKGYRVVQNSAEDLVRLANFLYEMTSDTPGWRVQDPPPQGPRPNQLIWPGNLRPRARFLPLDGPTQTAAAHG